MKRTRHFFEILAGLVFISALALGLIASFRTVSDGGQASRSLAASPTQCVPTPQPPQDVGTATQTPNPSEFGAPPPEAPSVTPLPISKTTDLAPDLPERDKGHVYVFHCNGTVELFLVGPDADVLSLQPGDVILGSSPPTSLMGHQPPEPTTAVPILETPTYVVPTWTTPTQLPYPVSTVPAEPPVAPSREPYTLESPMPTLQVLSTPIPPTQTP